MISGDAFLEKYGDHSDTVTVIDPKRSYTVKAPTRHPIYENFRVEVYLLTTLFVSTLPNLFLESEKLWWKPFIVLFFPETCCNDSVGMTHS